MPDVEKLQISPHLSCGKIGNYSECGEISDFSTSVMHINLKFLHMTIFSQHISFVIFVTNIRYECPEHLQLAASIINTFFQRLPSSPLTQLLFQKVKLNIFKMLKLVNYHCLNTTHSANCHFDFFCTNFVKNNQCLPCCLPYYNPSQSEMLEQ